LPLSDFRPCMLVLLCRVCFVSRFACFGDFAFGKRTGARPNLSRSRRPPLAPAWQHRLTENSQQLLSYLVAFFLIASVGETGQKSIESVPCHRETKLSRRYVQYGGSLVDGGTRQVVGRHAQHQFFLHHLFALSRQHMQTNLSFQRTQIRLDVPPVAV